LAQGCQKSLLVPYAREIQQPIRNNVKQLLEDKINQLNLSGFYKSYLNEIKGNNETSFIFVDLDRLTSDQLKSYEGIDWVWVEETQTISGHSLETLIPTICKEGSEL